jgi:hypothetical protein
MNKLTKKLALISVASAFALPAAAAESVITNLNNPLPAGTSWGVLPGENSGTIAITSAAARSGNGSIEITGDRTRAQTGVQFTPSVSIIDALSNVQSLTFDWQVAGDSGRQDYGPALRLLTQNGGQRSELIWEAANQPAPTPGGTQASLPTGNWYTTSADDKFYQFVAGQGPTYLPGTNTYVMMTLAQWISSAAYGSDATVSGISVGAGSSAGSAYHAFVDNVTYTTTRGSTTYNFETLVSAAPEPAAWSMMIIGFGIVGAATRRQKRRERAVLA